LSIKKPNLNSLYRFNEQEVKKFFKRASKRIKIEGLNILLAPRTLDYGRLLVITPRKSGNSPERNRIRRRIKHIFYEDNFYEKSFDWVIIVSKQAINLDFDRLKTILNKIINENT
jgi:ribonuclease P protein component